MDRRPFLGQVQSVRLIAAAVGLVTLVGVVTLYLGLIRVILARLRRLVAGLKALGPQGLGFEIADDRRDEIGVLIGHFNDMSRRVAQLVSTVVQEERARREAELEMLQYQIHPHFLSNVLDVFHARAQESGDTLGAEIEHASAYVALQRLRYEGTVDFHAELESWACAVLCPRFVLQPLVENCVVHGQREDRCLEILVAVTEAEEGLRVEVSDNGVGMDVRRLSWLRASLGSDPGNTAMPCKCAVGMGNVDRRLRAYAGTPAALAVESTPGGGTSVVFHLPERYGDHDRPGC
jgi:two-component system sensor histidine kinase YesM